jgi:excisionase family DNA binding protein
MPSPALVPDPPARTTFRQLRPAPPPTGDPWLTLNDAARETQVSLPVLRRAAQRGHLRAVRINGGHGPYRLRRSWLDAWMEE